MSAAMLKRLLSEVTCPLCLDIFTQPKRLPCEHVYCKQCLRSLALRSTNGSISCPECRRDIPVPSNFDVSIFSTSHQINRLVDMYRANLESGDREAPVAAVATPQPATPTAQPQPSPTAAQANGTCNLHNSQPLDLYCETCESLVCRDCALLSCSRKSHRYGFIDEMFHKLQTDWIKEIAPVQALHLQISAALNAMQDTEREMQGAREAKLKQVAATFDALSESLAQERRHSENSILSTFKEHEKLGYKKKSELSELLVNLESLDMGCGPMQEFLTEMADRMRIIRYTKEAATYLLHQEVTTPEITVNLLSPKGFQQICRRRNLIYSAHIEEPSDGLLVNETSEFTLHLSPHNVKVGEHITIEAQIQSHDDSYEMVSVDQVASKMYSLSFVPRHRGGHHLHVKYNDTHICGSPIPLYVTMQPDQLKKSSSIKVPNVGAIKCYEGSMYLSNSRDEILVLDSGTKKMKASIKLSGVHDFVVDGDHIYATDTSAHRIVKVDRDGTILKSVGSKGQGHGNFNHPSGIRLSKESEIYVCDTYNNRIQVLDKGLCLLHMIGGDDGCLQHPNDLDFDEEGNIYVTNTENHRIQVLSPRGQHVRDISFMPGEMSRSLAIHRNILYATSIKNKCVSAFKTTGEFITSIGKGVFARPECVAVDDNGYIHVTDNRSRVITF